MVLVDVNVLLYAFQSDYPQHSVYHAWIRSQLAKEGIALSEGVVSGFIRLATSEKMFSNPSTATEALMCISDLFATGKCYWLIPNPGVLDTFEELVEGDSQASGKVIPDAWLAALAISNQCPLATADKGFSRYKGLTYFDPKGQM